MSSSGQCHVTWLSITWCTNNVFTGAAFGKADLTGSCHGVALPAKMHSIEGRFLSRSMTWSSRRIFTTTFAIAFEATGMLCLPYINSKDGFVSVVWYARIVFSGVSRKYNTRSRHAWHFWCGNLALNNKDVNRRITLMSVPIQFGT